MAPNVTETEAVYKEESVFPKLKAPQADPWDYEISYINVVLFSYYHVAALFGAYLTLTSASWLTVVYTVILFVFSVLGITAGSHRLWSHRSYKVKRPLEIILILFNTLAGQYTAYNWARDHRMHHRYSDTDADPHNATRGFFFSHMGWLFVKKHPEVKKRGVCIDLSDLDNNPVLMFQRRYAAVIFALGCFVLPTLLPMFLWGETFSNAYHINFLRFVACLNAISLINSAAHMFGYKPYDKNIAPAENKTVKIVTFGEGFHNYHHTYPWDYRAAELGNQKYNLTTKFIELFAWIGWAYDLKSVDDDVITKRALKCGDGSRFIALND